MSDALQRRLAGVLHPDVASHVSAYLANIPDRSDALEYLTEFLDTSDLKHAGLLAELREEWRKPQGHVGEVAYMKSPLDPHGRQPQQAEIRLTPQLLQAAGPEKPHPAAQPGGSKPAGGGRRSDDKFVPLFSELGDQIAVAMLPGRHRCDCVATKHKLVNNCLGCGRIVCEQEGSGPCLFCGELVATKAETEILARGSKKSEQLRRQLMSAGLEAAQATKQKLLEYDKNSARRTKVIDDQMDYFESDGAVWLSDTERAKLRQREDELRRLRHRGRLERRPVYDFAGRRLVDDAETEPAAVGHVDPELDPVLREVAQARSAATAEAAGAPLPAEAPAWTAEDFPLANPAVACPPVFVQTDTGRPARPSQQQQQQQQQPTASASDERRSALRLQDAALRELRDEGLCLSLHQPWASLLVRGAKPHEGRTWYSAHRGRLWIAATARRPDPDEVAAVEAECRRRGAADGAFPTAYPTGCLLGCVHVDDVLAQEEYRARFPDGESESPFVFVCSNPQELLLKLPMRGEHKIYRLDKQLHKAALAGLRRTQAGSG